MQHQDTKRITLGLVLSRENVKKLTEGYAIHFSAEEMGMHTLDLNEIQIAFCETEEEAYEMMKENGFISEETKVVEEKLPRQQ